MHCHSQGHVLDANSVRQCKIPPRVSPAAPPQVPAPHPQRLMIPHPCLQAERKDSAAGALRYLKSHTKFTPRLVSSTRIAAAQRSTVLIQTMAWLQ